MEIPSPLSTPPFLSLVAFLSREHFNNTLFFEPFPPFVTLFFHEARFLD